MVADSLTLSLVTGREKGAERTARLLVGTFHTPPRIAPQDSPSREWFEESSKSTDIVFPMQPLAVYNVRQQSRKHWD
jgi:hypothetical protein